MKKTQKNIIDSAIDLFNRKGVGNVRLQDIARQTGISQGNLSYHFRTKKDLMIAVLSYMEDSFETQSGLSLKLLEQEDYLAIMNNYLSFQIGHRFFYRDILEVVNLVPEASVQYESAMKRVMNFTKNGLYLAVGKGIIHPEPHEGHFDYFAKNIWAVLNSWLVEREVLGADKLSLSKVIQAAWEFHFPYFTEKGRALFTQLSNQMPSLIGEE